MPIGGGSGSFVSPHGLIFTNHHVASDCLAEFADAQHDYMKDGFYAASQAKEMACPDLEANVLVALEDVSRQVKEAGAGAGKAADAVEKRNTAIAAIERSCAEKTGNHCSVVNLFAGERYDLYQYHRYTDLRLVFAPEGRDRLLRRRSGQFHLPRATTWISRLCAPTRTASPRSRRTI